MRPIELRIFSAILLIVLGASEVFLLHNVLYTEGEIMQGLYWLLLFLNLPIFAIAMWKPRWGLWGAIALAALLLPWQTAQNRKWAQIHEEVIEIIRFVEENEEASGVYPKALTGYDFRRDWVESHLTYESNGDSYIISYFMDHPSISYWYQSDDGFGYYPD